jgi:hypothetical protein
MSQAIMLYRFKGPAIYSTQGIYSTNQESIDTIIFIGRMQTMCAQLRLCLAQLWEALALLL